MKNEIIFEKIDCDFCKSNIFEQEIIGVDWEFGLNEKFIISKCVNCGLLQLNPRPAIQSLKHIYPDNYGFYTKETKPGLFQKLAVNIINRIKINFYNYPKNQLLYQYIKGNKGKIIDVGCGSGSTVYPSGYSGSLLDLKEKGWDVHGCEIDVNAAKIGIESGINIKIGMLYESDFKDNYFDIVRFNHSLEHSASPAKDLKKASQILKNKGILIISVPNINSAAYKLFGEYWSGLDLPRHFYHFSPTTLKKYLNQAGFNIEKEYFDSIPLDFTHSIKHFLNSKLFWNENKCCKSENTLNDIYKVNRNVKKLMREFHPLIKFFNDNNMGDNYTVISKINKNNTN